MIKQMIFKNLNQIRSFGREIYNDEHTLEDALEEQMKFENEIDKVKEPTKRKTLDKKEKNYWLNGFESGIFSIKNRHKEKDILLT